MKQGGRQKSRPLIVDRQKAFGRNLIAHEILRHLLHVFNCHLRAMTHVSARNNQFLMVKAIREDASALYLI